MGTSDRATEYKEWRQGAAIMIAMAVGAVVGGGALYLAEVIPYGWALGALVGVVVVFLAYSYWVYGR